MVDYISFTADSTRKCECKIRYDILRVTFQQQQIRKKEMNNDT